jgi:hypothetical protein
MSELLQIHNFRAQMRSHPFLCDSMLRNVIIVIINMSVECGQKQHHTVFLNAFICRKKICKLRKTVKIKMKI